jgi:hypothetical protein
VAPPAATARVSPPEAATGGTRYFYSGADFGTQSLYSPLWVFANRGFDVLQDHTAGRNVFAFDYRLNAGNVIDNLIHAPSRISADGWKTFLTQEIFPLSFTKDTARWTPNYSLHLIGGGMTFRAMSEWFEAHETPLPRLWAGLTLMAAALVNESLENKGVVGRNTDAIADIVFFDLGGILLFSFDAPSRFFSHTLVIADWSLQPAFTFPRPELNNVGNYFAAKWALPFYPRLRLFSYFGVATTGGLSFALDDQYSLSAAAGVTGTRIVNYATNVVDNHVVFAPTAAIFLDRRNSLLASVQVSDVEDSFVKVNLYPHALTPRGPAVGMWSVVDKHGRVAAGLSASFLLGMGAGEAGSAFR